MQSLPTRLRRWLVAIVIACVAFELVYLVAASILLRGDTLLRLINKKPEKMQIEWASARSRLPGVVTVDGLSLRGQSRKVQWSMETGSARARISLWPLVFKRFRVASATASGIDFRLRRRLDFVREGEEAPAAIVGAEFFPDIPGLTNPPDPKPEDLYPRKKKRRRPWTIDLHGVDVSGPVRVAVDRIRLEGEGTVSGTMTYHLRESIRVRRATLRLTSTELVIDGELASDDLTLDVDTRWKAFPPKGTKLPQVLGGISGTVAIAGNLHAKATVPIQLVPGMPIAGTGRLDTTLRLRNGVLQPGSSYSLESERFSVGLLGLSAVGSATVTASTDRMESEAVTQLSVDLGSYQFVDPADSAVGIEGTGMTVRATWDELSLAESSRASSVDVTLPPAAIRDVSVLGQLLPPQGSLSIDSGTGEVAGELAVDGSGAAEGQIDLTADDIRVTAQDVPMQADLEVHANLDHGDLPNRTFEVSNTTIEVSDVRDLTERPSKDDEPWWSTVVLSKGEALLETPVSASGSVHLKMRDTGPVVALISEMTTPPKWLSLMPNVKNVEGTMDIRLDDTGNAADSITITGDSLEILGWLHMVEKRADGRLYIKYKGLAAGISFDDGRSKFRLAKPRKWFDEQTESASPP